MFIDDLQWGDADSARAMFEVLRPLDSRAVFFLGSFRSDEVHDSRFLQEWAELKKTRPAKIEQRDVSVGPLTTEQCVELVVARTKRDDPSVRQRAKQLSQEVNGSPFFLNELIDCFDAATGSFDDLSLEDVTERKLATLPTHAKEILRVVAVSQQALPLNDALRAAGFDSTVASTVTQTRMVQLLRVVGTDVKPMVDTYHDRIRETVLEKLPSAAKITIHRTLARQLEDRCGLDFDQLTAELNDYQKEHAEGSSVEQIFDLAFHFDAAGDREKAWVYALLAAEQARRQFSLDVATAQYQIAQRNATSASNVTRFRIAKGASETLMLMGRYPEAREKLSGVIELTSDETQKAGLELLLGEVAFKQGAMKESMQHFEQGLRRLGNWVPRTKFGLVCGIIWETWTQAMHCTFSKRLFAKPPEKEDTLTCALLSRLCYPSLFTCVPKLSETGMDSASWHELCGTIRTVRSVGV
jgi:predicted ATPase